MLLTVTADFDGLIGMKIYGTGLVESVNGRFVRLNNGDSYECLVDMESFVGSSDEVLVMSDILTLEKLRTRKETTLASTNLSEEEKSVCMMLDNQLEQRVRQNGEALNTYLLVVNGSFFDSFLLG
jgi:hypothetical protein